VLKQLLTVGTVVSRWKRANQLQPHFRLWSSSICSSSTFSITAKRETGTCNSQCICKNILLL